MHTVTKNSRICGDTLLNDIMTCMEHIDLHLCCEDIAHLKHFTMQDCDSLYVFFYISENNVCELNYCFFNVNSAFCVFMGKCLAHSWSD